MVLAILSWVAVVVVTATSAGLLLNRDWRWDLGLLTVQYVGVAVLVAQHWPIGMAAASAMRRPPARRWPRLARPPSRPSWRCFRKTRRGAKPPWPPSGTAGTSERSSRH